MYIHSTVDPSIGGDSNLHSAALFVQWVPYKLSHSDWQTQAQPYGRHLLTIIDRFAPGFSQLVQEMIVMPPPVLERYFGIPWGHIHHIDNSYGFRDRHPYAVPGLRGLYSCSAGTHPVGAVCGSAGHNAASRVLLDVGPGKAKL
jgi:phytoene dehydrogenase-like protein